jgi:hypothetical protein
MRVILVCAADLLLLGILREMAQGHAVTLIQIWGRHFPRLCADGGERLAIGHLACLSRRAAEPDQVPNEACAILRRGPLRRAAAHHQVTL